MEYEFFKETLVSKYIKYLLQHTPLPQYPYIRENQYMIKGCLYTYRERILLCTYSGIFYGINGGPDDFDNLKVNKDLKVNDPFNVNGYKGKDNMHMDDYYLYINQYYTGRTAHAWMKTRTRDNENLIPLADTDDKVSITYFPLAEFKTIATFGEHELTPNVTQTYTTREEYYGPETHRMLGEYLRFLKNYKRIDLMSQYNCFNYEVVRDIVLKYKNNKPSVLEENNARYKVLMVPIKFGQNYTIAIDSPFRVMVHPVFYRDGKLLKDSRGQEYLHTHLMNTQPKDATIKAFSMYNTMNFDNPVLYRIDNYTADLTQFERYLYLAIQVPMTNTSSIVVLEGDFRNNRARVISDVSVLTKSSATLERLSDAMSSNLSLLACNDGKQRPFTDKLVQYLCQNTIDSREQIVENVSRVVKSLRDYRYGYDGQWTNYLRYTLYNRLHDYEERFRTHSDDILGYVDSYMEKILDRGYMNNG